MKQCLLIFFFSSFFFNSENKDFSYLDFNELISHADIILFATVIDECNSQIDGEEAFVQFKIETQIKGEIIEELIVNSKMLYQGDVSENLKSLETFALNEDYLIFLQKNAQSFTLLNQYTLKRIHSSDQEMFLPIHDQSTNPEVLMYTKSNLLNAIEGFVYNETEILNSEIIATE